MFDWHIFEYLYICWTLRGGKHKKKFSPIQYVFIKVYSKQHKDQSKAIAQQKKTKEKNVTIRIDSKHNSIQLKLQRKRSEISDMNMSQTR